MNRLLCLCLIACAQGPRAQPATRLLSGAVPHNVLVMILDDVGVTERSRLTALDDIAAVGVEMTRFYVRPVCSTTRAALLTGMYPRRAITSTGHGVGGLSLNAHDPSQDTLSLDLFTMFELFAPQYSTGLFGKWHLGRSPLDTGEDLNLSSGNLTKVQAPTAWHLQGVEHGRAVNPSVPNAGVGAAGFYDWIRGDAGKLTAETEYCTDVVRDEFLGWWGTGSEPQMAWLSWPEAHNSGPDDYEPPPGMSHLATVRADFEQKVDYLNAQIATVMASVDLSTTYVIVFSDNGTADDARPTGTPTGYWKFTTFEGGVHVPCVIAGPGITAGITSDRMAMELDIPATLAELSGVSIPAGFVDSRSFADALGNFSGTAPREFVFTERYAADYDDQAVIEKQTTFGGIALRMKLRRVDPDGAGAAASADYAYDLLADPYELAPTNPTLLPASIRNRLYAELASVSARQ